MGGKDMTKEEYNKRVAELSNNKLERKLLEKGQLDKFKLIVSLKHTYQNFLLDLN